MSYKDVELSGEQVLDLQTVKGKWSSLYEVVNSMRAEAIQRSSEEKDRNYTAGVFFGISMELLNDALEWAHRAIATSERNKEL